jgi:16S rRNA U516 pseudouridylate synthase RsuA-like enzyme
VPSISNLDLGNTDSDRRLHIGKGTNQPIKKSRKDQKALRNVVDPLSRKRSGKINIKPLSKGQFRYLQCIPKDTLSHYLEEMK